jgi:hypothetical protein
MVPNELSRNRKMRKNTSVHRFPAGSRKKAEVTRLCRAGMNNTRRPYRPFIPVYRLPAIMVCFSRMNSGPSIVRGPVFPSDPRFLNKCKKNFIHRRIYPKILPIFRCMSAGRTVVCTWVFPPARPAVPHAVLPGISFLQPGEQGLAGTDGSCSLQPRQRTDFFGQVV